MDFSHNLICNNQKLFILQYFDLLKNQVDLAYEINDARLDDQLIKIKSEYFSDLDLIDYAENYRDVQDEIIRYSDPFISTDMQRHLEKNDIFKIYLQEEQKYLKRKKKSKEEYLKIIKFIDLYMKECIQNTSIHQVKF
jgi:hypothetical protein